MAIYKPSNFYPNLDEIDLSKIEGQRFECQVNTDGARAKAYKIQLLSSKGDYLYEYLDNFETPIKNKEFADFKIDLYDITSYNPLKAGQTSENKTSLLLGFEEFAKFIGLENNEPTFSTRKAYIPYCLYNIQNCDVNYFCIYHVSGTNVKIINITDFDKKNKITTSSFIQKVDDKFYLGLKNGFDYKWTLRLYEDTIEEDRANNTTSRNTYISSGYLTGTNQSVVWTKTNDMKFQNIEKEEKKLSNIELSQNYVKLENYVELRATSDNSAIYKDQLKKGLKMTFTATYNQKEKQFICNSSEISNVVDFTNYLSNLYAKVKTKENVENIDSLTSLNKDKLFFSQLFKNEGKEYYSFDKILLTQDSTNIKFVYYNKNLSNYFVDTKSYDVTIYYVQREKIYDTVNHLGQNKDITQILLEDEMLEYLRHQKKYYLYTCDHKNSTTSFYGSPKGEIQVGRYVRFPTIDEKEFNYNNFPSGSVKTDETIERQGMFVPTKYFEMKTVDLDNASCIGFTNLNGLYYWYNNSSMAEDKWELKPPTDYASNVWIEDDDNGVYRTLYYDPNLTQSYQYNGSTFSTKCYMFISKEEYESTFWEDGIVGRKGNGKYWLRIIGMEGTLPNDYGKILKTNGSVISYFGNINIIVPNTFKGAQKYFNGSDYIFYISVYAGSSIQHNVSGTLMNNPTTSVFPRWSDTYNTMYFTISSNLSKGAELSDTTVMFTTTYKNPYFKTVQINSNYGVPVLLYSDGEYQRNNVNKNEPMDCSYKIKVPRGTKHSYNKFSTDNKTYLYSYLYINPRLIISEEDYQKSKGYKWRPFPQVNYEINVEDFIKKDEKNNYYYININLDRISGGGGYYVGKLLGILLSASINSLSVVVPKVFSGTSTDNSITGSSYKTVNGFITEQELATEQTSNFKQNKNSILYKIIGYDSDTGEIRLENETYRTLTDTDLYEIWERYEESGESSTEYYTRRLPLASEVNKYLYVGGETKAEMPCLNTHLETSSENDSELFIQPNINMKADENFNPCLIFETGDRIDLKYSYDSTEIKDFSKRDKTIDKLDNSQWIIKTDSNPFPIDCGVEYDIYSNFSDSFPENYFYARKTSNDIVVKYVDTDNFKEDITLQYDKAPYNYPNLGDDKILDNPVVRTMDCTFIGVYTGDTAIRRYRYKFFDNMGDIIKDTQDIYSNDITVRFNGLNNGEKYILYLEIEDQLGYLYKYETTFFVQYSMKEMFAITPILKPSTTGNGIAFYFTENDYITLKNNTAEILVYKYRKKNKLEYVTNLTLVDSNLVEIEKDFKVLGAIDYNIANDSNYEYIFVISKTIKEFTTIVDTTDYVIAKKQIRTCFKQWALYSLNIINPQENYSVNEIWELKCNLAEENITQNLNNQQINVLDKYAQVSYGENNYQTGQISCLLGDISKHVEYETLNKTIQKEGYNEFNGIKENNNVDLLLDWNKMCASVSLKFLQDFKGNKWLIALYDNPNYNINLNTIEQMTTINCSWVEVQDSSSVSIVKNLTPYKKNLSQEETVLNELKSYWEKISTDGTNIILESCIATSDGSVILPYLSGYSYTIIIDGNTSPFSKVANKLQQFIVMGGLPVTFKHRVNDQLIANDASYLFNGCNELVTIDCDSLKNSSVITNYTFTFKGCPKLTFEIGLNQSSEIITTDMCENSEKLSIRINSDNIRMYDELVNQYPQNDSSQKVKIKSIYLPDESAFEFDINDSSIITKYNGNLKTLFLPQFERYTTIQLGEKFLEGTNVQKLAIPSNYIEKGERKTYEVGGVTVNPFAMSNLTNVSCEHNRNFYVQHYGEGINTNDESIYLDANKTILLFYLAKSSDFIIPKTVTKICRYAFSNNYLQNLTYFMDLKDDKTGIKLLDKVNFETNNGIQEIGAYCFANSSLTFFSLPYSISNISENFCKDSKIKKIAINRELSDTDKQKFNNLNIPYQDNCMNWEFCGSTDVDPYSEFSDFSINVPNYNTLKGEKTAVCKLKCNQIMEDFILSFDSTTTNKAGICRDFFTKKVNQNFFYFDSYLCPNYIYIEENISWLDDLALSLCTSWTSNIKQINFYNNDSCFISFGGISGHNSGDYQDSTLHTINFKEEQTYWIGAMAFAVNSKLKTLGYLESSTTYNSSQYFVYVGDNAFYDTLIETIYVQKGAIYTDNSLSGMNNLNLVQGINNETYSEFLNKTETEIKEWDSLSEVKSSWSKGADPKKVQFQFYIPNCTYEFNNQAINNQNLTVTVETNDFSNIDFGYISPFLGNSGSIKTLNLTFPSNKRGNLLLGNYFFRNLKLLETVGRTFYIDNININNSKYLCCGCRRLQSFPDKGNWSTIGEYAFAYTNFYSISGDNITVINNFAFYGCLSLVSVILPNVKKIGVSSFSNCVNLNSFRFGLNKDFDEAPLSEYRLEDNCFAVTGLSFLYIPSQFGTISENILEGNSTNVSINQYQTDLNLSTLGGTGKTVYKYSPWNCRTIYFLNKTDADLTTFNVNYKRNPWVDSGLTEISSFTPDNYFKEICSNCKKVVVNTQSLPNLGLQLTPSSIVVSSKFLENKANLYSNALNGIVSRCPYQSLSYTYTDGGRQTQITLNYLLDVNNDKVLFSASSSRSGTGSAYVPRTDLSGMVTIMDGGIVDAYFSPTTKFIYNVPNDLKFISDTTNNTVQIENGEIVCFPYGERELNGVVAVDKVGKCINYGTINTLKNKFQDVISITKMKETTSTIWVPRSLIYIQENAFCKNSTLLNVTKIEYEGTEEEWEQIYIADNNFDKDKITMVYNVAYENRTIK